MINVLFFRPVAERAGISSLCVESSSGLTVAALRDEMAKRYPDAFSLVSLIAVDGHHERNPQRVLDDGAEVVFMSKFSGG